VLDHDPGWTGSIRAALEHARRRVLEARTADEAIALLGQSQASLVVVGPRSVSALARLAAARRRPEAFQIIVVARHADSETASAAFAAGATALISDSAADESLVSALAVAAATKKPDPFALSERESEILGFVVRGSSNAEIARALWVSEPTVKFHLSRIYKKLGVSSRTEATWVARTHGLVSEMRAS
jgi:DNA-binding NarL/FixJ family response regulator